MSIVDLYSAVYASITRKEKFSNQNENCQKNVSDLGGSLATSSSPPGRPQKRPDDRTSNAGVAVRIRGHTDVARTHARTQRGVVYVCSVSVCCMDTRMSSTDPDAILMQTRVGPRNHVLDRGTHWRHLANTI